MPHHQNNYTREYINIVWTLHENLKALQTKIRWCNRPLLRWANTNILRSLNEDRGNILNSHSIVYSLVNQYIESCLSTFFLNRPGWPKNHIPETFFFCIAFLSRTLAIPSTVVERRGFHQFHLRTNV